MMMTLHEAAAATAGQLLMPAARTASGEGFAAVSTDSRAVGAGMLFVALAGERFDAHDFMADVAARGAVAAIVRAERAEGLRVHGLPLIAVDDPRLALGRLAKAWRARFAIPVLAVTGSNGKTTTKEMIAGILRAQSVLDGGRADEVLATAGNLNNDIGLPLTLLSLRDGHRYAVVELGMNHPGEIAYLADIARPDAGLVINALRAHLEGMGSLAGVAREKGSLFEYLAPGGVAVIAADSEFAPLWRQQANGRRRLEFSTRGAGEVNGAAILAGLGIRLELLTPSGVARLFLHAPGAHNASNATAAAALCLAAGCSLTAIQRGLESFAGVKGRLQKKTAAGGALLIDDTYNANPDSMRAAIDVLAALPQTPRLLVLGDMGEVGPAAVELHREIGAYARQKQIDRLFALGEMSCHAVHAFGQNAGQYTAPEALCADLRAVLTPGAAVLVKGSRFMRMERVVALLEAAAEQPITGAARCC